MSLIEQINHGIKEAIRSKDQIRLNTLRMLKTKILTVDARANLPDAEVLKLFKTYSNSLKEARDQSISRPDIVEQLEKEIAIVQEFLPKELSLEETKKIVIQAVAESGAKSKKELGLVMKSIMKQGHTIDGKLAKKLADELLSD